MKKRDYFFIGALFTIVTSIPIIGPLVDLHLNSNYNKRIDTSRGSLTVINWRDSRGISYSTGFTRVYDTNKDGVLDRKVQGFLGRFAVGMAETSLDQGDHEFYREVISNSGILDIKKE